MKCGYLHPSEGNCGMNIAKKTQKERARVWGHIHSIVLVHAKTMFDFCSSPHFQKGTPVAKPHGIPCDWRYARASMGQPCAPILFRIVGYMSPVAVDEYPSLWDPLEVRSRSPLLCLFVTSHLLCPIYSFSLFYIPFSRSPPPGLILYFQNESEYLYSVSCVSSDRPPPQVPLFESETPDLIGHIFFEESTRVPFAGCTKAHQNLSFSSCAPSPRNRGRGGKIQ